MKEKLQSNIYKYSCILEVIISMIVVIAIVISISALVFDGIITFYHNRLDADALKTFLSLVFNVVIGIEFLKMLCNPTFDITIEILLFSIARQLLIEHMSLKETLVGVFCIMALFVVKSLLNKHQRNLNKNIYE